MAKAMPMGNGAKCDPRLKHRHAARHAGKRQFPFAHEHNLMRPAEGSAAEEASESPAEEAAEQAAGRG